MGKALDAAQIDRFHRDGFLAPIQAATAEEALGMRRWLEAYEAEHGGPLKGSVRFKSHLLFKWLADFVRSPSVLDPVEDIIGPDIMVWSTDWWLKEARSPSYVSWHQDSQYWGLDSDKLVTVWVALSRSKVASGCMRYMPGSHLGPDLPHRETFHDDNLLTRGQEITEGIDESRAVNVELEPGEGSIFAFRIAHASHPNRSDDRRIGLAIRFIPPDARQVRSDHDSVALVRGVDTHGHFEIERGARVRFRPARRGVPPVGGGRTPKDPLPRHRLADPPHLSPRSRARHRLTGERTPARWSLVGERPQGLRGSGALGSANRIGEEPLSHFRFRQPASRMGGDLAESDVQVVLVGHAVFEHPVEQPKDPMTSNVFFLCQFAQSPISG